MRRALTFDACRIGAFGSALDAPGRFVALASDTRRHSCDGDATVQDGVFTCYQMPDFGQVGFVYTSPTAPTPARSSSPRPRRTT